MTKRLLGCRPAETRKNQPMLSVMKGFCSRTAPARLVRDHIDPSPCMLGNDAIGDCTSAGIGNHIRATSALGGFQTAITTDQAIKFYSLSTGYDPANPKSDMGGIEVDVLTTAQRSGYAATNQTLFPLWGSADPSDLNGIRNITAGLSAAYLGVELSESDMWEDEDGNLPPVWDTAAQVDHGNPNPGSAGGHCLLLWDYSGTSDEDLVTLLTWGGKQKATWRWVASRATEVHGLAWSQLRAPGGLYPVGDDWASLVQANSAYLKGMA